MSVCVSVSISVSVNVCLSVRSSVRHSFCPPLCLRDFLPVCLSYPLSVHLSLRLSVCLSFFLGSGPYRGQCPVEQRGKFHLSVRPSVCPPPSSSCSEAVSGCLDGRMDRISPLCSTGHCPLLGPLPCLHLAFAQQLMAGQGYH